MIDFAIMTAGEKASTEAFNTPQVALGARLVDAVAAPAGVKGKYVAPRRILTDPDYLTYAPGMVAALAGLPHQSLDPAVLFAP